MPRPYRLVWLKGGEGRGGGEGREYLLFIFPTKTKPLGKRMSNDHNQHPTQGNIKEDVLYVLSRSRQPTAVTAFHRVVRFSAKQPEEKVRSGTYFKHTTEVKVTVFETPTKTGERDTAYNHVCTGD